MVRRLGAGKVRLLVMLQYICGLKNIGVCLTTVICAIATMLVGMNGAIRIRSIAGCVRTGCNCVHRAIGFMIVPLLEKGYMVRDAEMDISMRRI